MYITMKAEVYQNGAWTKVGNVFQSALHEDLITDRVCDEHNPILFEVLGARNAYKYEHTDIEPVKHTVEDGYTVYLDDLLKYNWDATVARKGIISEWQYRRLQTSGVEPINKNRVVPNQDAQLVTLLDMDAILLGQEDRVVRKYYVSFLYDEKTLKECCSFFYNNSLQKLTELIPDNCDANCVRVLYNFID